MANVINFDVNDNRVEYKLGKTGRSIFIDTGDINLPVRLADAMDNLSAYFSDMNTKFGVKELDDIDKVKTGSIENDIALLRKTDTDVRKIINAAFNNCSETASGFYDICAAAFGEANCCSVSKKSGNYYFEEFLAALYPVIEAEYNVRVEKLKKKVSKYTANKGKYSQKGRK